MAEHSSSAKLIRAVGFWGLVAFTINAVIGSGVYLLPSETFRLLGPFSLWAPLLFSIPVFILVLCFAEAASHFDKPGGAYVYSRAAFGDFIGFETGWMNTLARLTSLAALSNGLVLSIARLAPGAAEGVMRTWIIVGTLLFFGVIHALGIRFGAGTIYGLTLGKLIPLVIFIAVAVAVFHFNPLPASVKLPPIHETQWSEAALLLLFAYAGFENVAVPAGEFRNPKRDLPFALLLGIVGIALVYSLAQLGAMASLQSLDTSTPIADAAAVVLGKFGAVLITVGAIISIAGTNVGTVLESSRMVYALSADRKPYKLLAWVHPTFHTPVVAIALIIAAAIPMALMGSFVQLAALSAVARMTTYLFTAASLPRLKKGGSFFLGNWAWVVAILGTLISLLLFFTLEEKHFVPAILALLTGAVLWVGSRIFGKIDVEAEEASAET
ncbi:MAG: APC family permease [Thermoanaerobaculia bacterium]